MSATHDDYERYCKRLDYPHVERVAMVGQRILRVAVVAWLQAATLGVTGNNPS
jgi:hypothetical protein